MTENLFLIVKKEDNWEQTWKNTNASPLDYAITILSLVVLGQDEHTI